jgi:hypothetical protein
MKTSITAATAAGSAPAGGKVPTSARGATRAPRRAPVALNKAKLVRAGQSRQESVQERPEEELPLWRQECSGVGPAETPC